ncbi:hypothetical protein CR513_23580, partial [Mucuna pruriens]
MVTMFIDTLQTLFYNRMVGNVSSNCFDLIVIGKQLKMKVRNGKIMHVTTESIIVTKTLPNTDKRKGGEANVVTSSLVANNHKSPQVTLSY